jgi:hypothetical protein
VISSGIARSFRLDSFLRNALQRNAIGRHVGHLDEADILRLNVALAFVMGLAD